MSLGIPVRMGDRNVWKDWKWRAASEEAVAGVRAEKGRDLGQGFVAVEKNVFWLRYLHLLVFFIDMESKNPTWLHNKTCWSAFYSSFLRIHFISLVLFMCYYGLVTCQLRQLMSANILIMMLTLSQLWLVGALFRFQMTQLLKAFLLAQQGVRCSEMASYSSAPDQIQNQTLFQETLASLGRKIALKTIL